MHILIFTDSDLDGAGSALLLKEVYAGHDIIVVETTEYSILNEFKNRWNTLDHFAKIFVILPLMKSKQLLLTERM